MVALDAGDIVPESTSRTFAGLACCVVQSVSAASIAAMGRRVEVCVLGARDALGDIQQWSLGWAVRASEVDGVVQLLLGAAFAF